jgi:hypothetical protein
MMNVYLLEFQFPDRRQVDHTVAFSRREAEARAQRLLQKGLVAAAWIIPLRRGRSIPLHSTDSNFSP